MWHKEYGRDSGAAPEAIWRLFKDVAGWPKWNAGIEEIEIHGPFEVGTEFTMKPPGEGAFRSRLVEVDENRSFTDETRIGEVCVTVEHRIDPLPAGGVRVVYAATVTGPDAEEIGEAVTADFPDVLEALAAKAEAT